MTKKKTKTKTKTETETETKTKTFGAIYWLSDLMHALEN